MSIIREKHHRLLPELYRGFVSTDFTARMNGHDPFFTSLERFQEHESYLLRALREQDCESEVYLFMPDHLHVIVTGRTDDSDSREAMRKFKQYSGFALSKAKLPVKWQKDFYDHVLRENESLRNHLIYILNNPIRKGLCSTWDEYPFKGSTVFDLKTFR